MSKIVVTDIAWPTLDNEARLAHAAGHELVLATSDADLLRLAADADAIMTCFRPVTSEVLDRATKCRTVARYGVGVDNIDVTTATELGIIVSNVPTFCTEEVADHTVLLALAALRSLPAATEVVRGGSWSFSPPTPPRRLRGLTFGIVGFGSIGKAVAARLPAFGVNVMVASRHLPAHADELTARGIRVVDLPTLLATADIISLHLALTPDTRRIIGSSELATMKEGSLLINVSRGGLVDTDALEQAVASGHVRAALDVTEPEPLPPGHWLRHSSGALVTPHVAYISDGALVELAETATSNAIDVLADRPPASIVNPHVLASPRLRSPALASTTASK